MRNKLFDCKAMRIITDRINLMRKTCGERGFDEQKAGLDTARAKPAAYIVK